MKFDDDCPVFLTFVLNHYLLPICQFVATIDYSLYKFRTKNAGAFIFLEEHQHSLGCSACLVSGTHFQQFFLVYGDCAVEYTRYLNEVLTKCECFRSATRGIKPANVAGYSNVIYQKRKYTVCSSCYRISCPI